MSNPSDHVVIGRSARWEMWFVAALSAFLLVSIAIDPNSNVPLPAIAFLALFHSFTVWRVSRIGVRGEGSTLVVVNALRTISIPIGSITAVGPPPDEMGRLYVVHSPDGRRLRFTCSPQRGPEREAMRSRLEDLLG